MWVRISDGHMVNLDHYQRVVVMGDESKCELIGINPGGIITPEGQVPTAKEKSYTVLAKCETREQAIGLMDRIKSNLHNSAEGPRHYCDLRA
jgi:hypothetical protein